ncbi:MAG: NUDIX domain-containing protein [Clostridia bacterium]|nr:NUDIX domain-containing protein [Clostridia bacterium]
MSNPYLTPSAVILILMRERGGKKQILLQRRRNTGFADGLWDFSCAGKVEEGESMTAAAVREAKEELGITVAAENLQFAVLIHKCDKTCKLVYYNAYFVCTDFIGEPTVCEPEKCSELKWFDLDNLPDDLIDDRKCALKAYLDGKHYIEFGW